MLDCVLALEWVRDNVAAFNGDPDCVTIAGQSGGGGKVSALMMMSAAKGLFHRAVVMSGSFPPAQSAADSQRFSDAVIAELGGSSTDLTAVPPAALVAAGEEVIRKSARPGIPGIGRGRMRLTNNWTPVADGRTLPFIAAERAIDAGSRGVPLLVGNVRDEFKLPAMVFDEAMLMSMATRIYGDAARPVLSALAEAFPGRSANIRAGLLSGVQFHNGMVDQARAKATLDGEVYAYWFTYAPPLLDGRIGVPHCADIAYFFDNAAACDQQTGNGREARRVATVASDALVRFARTGNPGWPRFGSSDQSTMVLDRAPQVQSYPGKAFFEATRA